MTNKDRIEYVIKILDQIDVRGVLNMRNYLGAIQLLQDCLEEIAKEQAPDSK